MSKVFLNGLLLATTMGMTSVSFAQAIPESGALASRGTHADDMVTGTTTDLVDGKSIVRKHSVVDHRDGTVSGFTTSGTEEKNSNGPKKIDAPEPR